VEGSTGYTYEDIWTRTAGHYHNIDGGRAIDPTHPGTRQRIAVFISKFKACGFKMIKIDFLGHAAIEADRFYDTTVTTGMQAYRKGMEYLVDQLGDQFLIYAAISPSLATGRYVHIRRIACDAFKSIKDTRYTLNSVNYGWWQTYIYNYIDADHIVFGNESAGVNRARLASGLITGSLITGDDYSAKGPWMASAKALLQKKEILELVKNGVAFRPVEGNSGDSANELYELSIGKNHYLAVFNFSDIDKAYTIDMGRIGLDRNRNYKLVEIFSNNKLTSKAVLNCTIGKTDAAIYKFSL
jgi:alpha-galactosidase